ncbi:MAG: TetR/AcrR family transcriptional regulator, partial [Polyangiaceae bacterium]|nr:TetR/AcrR family transcriptional regulator [Polyangiaceae bacterium]
MTKTERKESVRQARKEMYRQLIFEAAERVFSEQGFDGAKMQDVAAEAGLSLGTLYAIFAGKAELFQAIQESRRRELMEHARGEAPSNASAVAQLLHAVRAYAEFLLDHPNFLRIHSYEGRALGLAKAPAWAPADDQPDPGIELMLEAFERCIAEGALYDDDALLMARMTVAAEQALLADYFDRPETADRARLLERAQLYVKRSFIRP